MEDLPEGSILSTVWVPEPSINPRKPQEGDHLVMVVVGEAEEAGEAMEEAMPLKETPPTNTTLAAWLENPLQSLQEIAIKPRNSCSNGRYTWH